MMATDGHIEEDVQTDEMIKSERPIMRTVSFRRRLRGKTTHRGVFNDQLTSSFNILSTWTMYSASIIEALVLRILVRCT